MAKSFFTIDEISQIVNGKGASLLPKKEVKEKEPLAERDELLKMVFGGSILPSETLQDSALQLDQALASNEHLNNLRTATAVAGIVGDAAVEAVGIAEESYNNTYGENALAKKISKGPIERLKRKDENAFGSEGKKRIFAALGIDEEDTREVEVEGGEIIENEDGTTQKVEGPKHEQGGVDAMIDDDATVYSDRLQSLIGASKVEKTAKSIAEEKEKRDAKALSLQKKLEKNPNDRLLANTLALTLQQNMIADQIDLMWQNIARMGLEEQAGGKEQLMNAMFNKQDKTESEESEKQQEPQTEEEQQEPEAEVEQEPQPEEEQQEQYAYGFEPNAIPFVEEDSEKKEDEKTKETQELLSSISNISSNQLTTESPEKTAEEKKKEEEEKTKRIQAIAGGVGDMLGNQLYTTGAIISGLGGLNTTLQQRSEDILHENKYKGLARGVDKLYEQSISNISNVTNKRLQEMLNESQTTKQSIGNNFQSISNMAAYNAMLDDAVNKELAKIRGEELGAITGIQDARAKVLSANMQKEMEGQGIAEALNDADRDAFYNALHLDYANIGTQMQAVGSQQTDKYKDKTDIKRLLEELKKWKDEEEETEDGNDGKGSKGAQGTGTPTPQSNSSAAPSTVTTTPASPPAQSDAANTGTGTPPSSPTQSAATNAEEVTTPSSSTQQPATNAKAQAEDENKPVEKEQEKEAGTTSPSSTQTAATNAKAGTSDVVTIKSFYDKEVSALTDEELLVFLSFENYTIENGGRVSNEDFQEAKKEKEKRDAEKNNNKEDN